MEQPQPVSGDFVGDHEPEPHPNTGGVVVHGLSRQQNYHHDDRQARTVTHPQTPNESIVRKVAIKNCTYHNINRVDR